MREIVVHSWCDACAPDRTPAETFKVALDGGPLREIDLCDPHEKELLQGLRELLDARSRPPEAQPATPSQQTLPGVGSGYACPICRGTSKSVEGLLQHVKNHHELNRSALYGTVCPECGEEAGLLGAHAKVHGVGHVVELFAGLGRRDPVGVVAGLERNVWAPARKRYEA